jgi:uncharacterized membrane protein/glutaredoxin
MLMRNSNISQIIYLLAKEIKIPLTRESISNELTKHPNPDSMLAINELLNAWQVPNAPYKVNMEELDVVPVPFIAYMKKSFVLVNNLNDREVTISDGASRKKQLPREDFKKAFSGAILAVGKHDASGELNYKPKRRKEVVNKLRVPFLIAGAAMILVGILAFYGPGVNFLNVPFVSIMICTISGLIISTLLLLQSIDAHNPLIKRICGGDSNKNCNAILSSEAAKITPEVSWSEVGFFYFAGTLVALIFVGKERGIIHTLAFFNFLGLFYTFYSIYYQWRIARHWCILCCSIQAVLWLQFLSYLLLPATPVQFPELKGIAGLLTAMAAPVIFWVFIKPYLRVSVELQPLKEQLRHFKYNKDLFYKHLNQEMSVALPKDDDTLIIGNLNAKNVITIITNPFCQPCAKAHKLLDEWTMERDDIKIQTVFYTTTLNDDKKAVVANHLMALQAENDEPTVKKALNHWFKERDLDTLKKSFPLTHSKTMQEELDTQRSWFRLTGVMATPALFINGRRLPSLYQLEDIKYLL